MTEIMNHPDLVGSFVTFAMGNFDGQHGRIVAISQTQPDGAQDGDVPFVDIKLYDIEDLVEACGPLAYVVHDESPIDRAHDLVGQKVRWHHGDGSTYLARIGTVTSVPSPPDGIDIWTYYDDPADLNCARVNIEFFDGQSAFGACRSSYEPWEPPVIDDITEAQVKIEELEGSLAQLSNELEQQKAQTVSAQSRFSEYQAKLTQRALDNDIDIETLDVLEIPVPRMKCRVTVTYELKGRRSSGGNSLDEGFIRQSLIPELSLDSDWDCDYTTCDVLETEVDDAELDL